MSHLERPGANIWHESVGEGPVLLCISWGDGYVDIWRMFANALKEKFTVVMWDRRGFSPNERIREVLGLEVEVFPGEHVAHLTHADAFSKRLVEY